MRPVTILSHAASMGCFLFGLVALVGPDATACHAATAQPEAQWIWSPAGDGNPSAQTAPAGVCFFRKSFDMTQPESGEVQITCDESYELYVNGRKVADGKHWRVLDIQDITKYLITGRNTVGIRGTKTTAGPAGMAARILVKNSGSTYIAYLSDGTWKTSKKEFPRWAMVQFDDSQWIAARAIGTLGIVKPWLDEVQVAGGSISARFKTAREFRVEPVIPADDTGSLIRMAFNEFGEILASREGGPLLLLHVPSSDSDKGSDKTSEKTTEKPAVYCDQIKNIQGILPLNGQVFVVGDGPQGAGLYRLTDEDGDGKATKVDVLLKFTGGMTEHGPHLPILGPDGFIYVLLGDHTTAERAADATSPHHHYYEGDLLTPRYEDPHGYGVGVKAPGGCIVRTDTQGSFMEVFAGGLRNPYGMAFNRQGELFTQDSDMEWDVGTPWYRPTRVQHIVPGAEFGWRSGWAAWPSYYFDSLPSTVDTGRGSPTGIVAYNHVMFPRRFHNSLFVGDWARGRILNVRLAPAGGSYTADVEVFLEGKPLNITDLAVGPDGWLYFCTGGRGTEGGVYRVVWEGKVPPTMTQQGTGLESAIRQPQLDSAWARQRIAIEKKRLGAAWNKELPAVADNLKAKPEFRCRALDLMQLVGPFPAKEQLIRLSHDKDDEVRAKATFLMGIQTNDATGKRLVKLLHDPSLMIQRVACEALVRAGQKASWSDLEPLLKSPDRFIRWAATRTLEQTPTDQWKADALKAESQRAFLQGALALLTLDPDRATVDAILARVGKIMSSYVSDPDFLDLLRVTELAVQRGKLIGDDVPELRKQLANEYPSKDRLMNRELVRLLVYLQEPSVTGRIIEQLQSDAPEEEKLHVAMCARYLQGWSTTEKLELLKFYEHARTLSGGYSFSGYIENVSRDFFAGLTESERKLVLADGTRWPSSALSVVARLPEDPGQETLSQLQQLDRQLTGMQGEPVRRLGIGIVAELGRSGNAQSMAYLREVYEKDPARRGYIIMALAQHPEDENWPVLVQSLSWVEGAFAREVLVKLATVDRAPDGPEPLRQVILRGLKLKESGGQYAVALLEKWTDQKLGKPDDKWDVALAAWQKWFSETYPDQAAPALPVDSAENRWTYDELLSFLNSPEATAGDPRRGAAVYVKAQCIKCHRYGDRGEGVGPDLTAVSRRFQKKEILESILFPSQVISDQYASKSVEMVDGRSVWGIVAPQTDGSLIVVQSDAEKVTVPKEQIEKITPIKKSAMPEGLLNSLSLDEIADLFAYLNQLPEPSVTSRRTAIQK